MKTKTVGELLQEERELRRISLEELSQRTRIRLEYLQALELNQFEKLPAATFVKGYIKTYGQLFGFEYQPLLALLRRDYGESAKGQLVPRDFIQPVLKKRVEWAPASTALIAAIAIFVTLFSYVGWQWYALNRPPMLQVTNPSDNQIVAPQVEIAGQTTTDATVTVNAQTIPLATDGTFTTQIFIPRQGIATITIEAKDRRGKSTVVQRTVQVQF
jgi:cytoskeleton protein RodZ